MKLLFKKGNCPLWNSIIDSCPDNVIEEDFVEACHAKLILSSDGFTYKGIEFETEADYVWFLLKI